MHKKHKKFFNIYAFLTTQLSLFCHRIFHLFCISCLRIVLGFSVYLSVRFCLLIWRI